MKRLKEWIIKNYEDKPESKASELIWLKKIINHGEKINWSFVDTVDYNIDSIPRRREIIFEFKPRKIKHIKGMLK